MKHKIDQKSCKDIYNATKYIFFQINTALLNSSSKNPEKNASQFPQEY